MTHIEDIYFTLGHFCNYRKYPLAKNLRGIAETQLVKICKDEELSVIRKRNKLTGKIELAFPQSVLEDFFKLYIQ
jgi:hypothetical protein